MSLILKRNFCFEVIGRFAPRWMVTLYTPGHPFSHSSFVSFLTEIVVTNWSAQLLHEAKNGLQNFWTEWMPNNVWSNQINLWLDKKSQFLTHLPLNDSSWKLESILKFCMTQISYFGNHVRSTTHPWDPRGQRGTLGCGSQGCCWGPRCGQSKIGYLLLLLGNSSSEIYCCTGCSLGLVGNLASKQRLRFSICSLY